MSGPPAGTTSIGWATFIPRSFPEGKCSCGTRVSSAAPGGDYPEKQLMEWARRLCRWEPTLGHTSTSNDIGGHAIRNARSLRALMGIFAKHLLPAVS